MGLFVSAVGLSNPAGAFSFWREKPMAMHFNPDRDRHYVGFHLPADQLAALDQVRIELRLSRSQFVRQAVAAHVQQLQAAPK